VPDASTKLHEDPRALTPEIVDRHRAIMSLAEELEAIDWYDQRVAATDDDALRAVLAHNRDEEREHAAMVLEWLRRNDPVWDRVLRTYLFTDAPITLVEERVDHADAERVDAPGGSLGIGDLRS
jgi:uncharacterized protein